MSGHLSKREKVLVVLALCVGLGFLGFKFLIIPALDMHSAAIEKLSALTIERQLMEMKLSGESTTKEAYEKKLLKYDEVQDIYPAPLTNENLDKLITGICLENSIITESLGMSTIKTLPAAAVATPENEAAVPTIFTVASVNVTASGSYESLMNLIDYAQETPYVMITLLSFSGSKDATAIEEKPPSVTLLFEVIMADTEIKAPSAETTTAGQ